MNRDLLRSISLITGGILIGSGTTYLIVNKRLQTKYMLLSQVEINDAKEHYKLLRGQPPYDDPATALRAYNERYAQLEFWSNNGLPEESSEEPEIFNELVEIDSDDAKALEELLEDNSYTSNDDKVTSNILKRATAAVNHEVHPPSQAQSILTLEDVVSSPEDVPEEITTGENPRVGNIFEIMKEPTEAELRNKEFPYIISEDEFHNTELKYEKTSLIYYKDDVLADLQGSIISDIKGLLGKTSLNNFGHDKANPEMIFVRNDVRKVDLEVTRDEKTYAEDVFGIVPEG